MNIEDIKVMICDYSMFARKFTTHKKALTAETVRALLFYSAKHVNVNITPIR